MATVEKAHAVPEGTAAAPPATNQADAKKAINRFEGELDEHRLSRAATEYMLALRPQPSREMIEIALLHLTEKNEKGELKHKCKSTDEVPSLVDAELKHGSAHA